MILGNVNQTTAAQVLLVEDDPDDVELTRRALMEHKLILKLDIVGDGEEAMRYLRRQPPYADKMLPDLVLLDLNLPRMDGREVLAQIRSDETLRSIPVVVLTTSTDDVDVIKAYNLNANCYISKPVGMKNFSEVVHKIEDFWFSVVRLPRPR